MSPSQRDALTGAALALAGIAAALPGTVVGGLSPIFYVGPSLALGLAAAMYGRRSLARASDARVEGASASNAPGCAVLVLACIAITLGVAIAVLADMLRGTMSG